MDKRYNIFHDSSRADSLCHDRKSTRAQQQDEAQDLLRSEGKQDAKQEYEQKRRVRVLIMRRKWADEEKDYPL